MASFKKIKKSEGLTEKILINIYWKDHKSNNIILKLTVLKKYVYLFKNSFCIF